MTKDVLITVTGRQFDVSDEPIELTTEGTYYFKNGKHYVLYEECPDGGEQVVRNRVKFSNDSFEMVKNGAVSSALKFIKNESTSSMYHTDAGTVVMEVHTHDVFYSETEELLNIRVGYDLLINGGFISVCEVDFRVRAR